MGEIIIFLVAGIGCLFVMGYTVHMFVGGLVSPESEHLLIAIACSIVGAIMAYMAWDVVQRRAGKK